MSEFRKASYGKADRNVAAWAAVAAPATLFVSVISIMEREVGMLRISRRDAAQGTILRTWLTTYVLPSFASRVLPVDTLVAMRCARLHVPDLQPERDALIAATALVHGMTVVTRNVADLQRSGVPVINPWDA